MATFGRVQRAQEKVENLQKAYDALAKDHSVDGPGGWELGLYLKALVKAQVELAALTGKPRGES